MVKIVHQHSTKKLLDNASFPKTDVRPYLSMSSTGEFCSRKRWYALHLAAPPRDTDARSERIFKVGHLFEEVLIEELKSIGYDVYKMVDGQKIVMTGKEDELQEELIGFFGHERGHPDGRVRGVIEAPKTEHLLEIKTMKEKYFKTLFKQGLKESNRGYYDQCQKYMGKMKLTRTFFVAINKNDCSYYIERIEFDKSYAADLDRRDADIIMSDAPPPKAYIKGFWKCTGRAGDGLYGCTYNGVCHEGEEPQKNCRTCDFSDMEVEGKWMCTNPAAIGMLSKGRCEDDYELSFKRQIKGCRFWRKGWNL